MRVGVGGSSAGGHLASWVSNAMEDGEKPAFAILHYGAMLRTQFYTTLKGNNALLGKGFTYDESMAQLGGVTLEGIVITERTAVAVEQLADLGKINLSDFPLLMHIKELLFENKTINVPWKAFETEYEG
jgi:glycerol-3-phosphate dehydrogenase (NAD(P)+)